MRRTHREFVEAAEKMGHRLRLPGKAGSDCSCTCGSVSFPTFGGGKAWRAFRKHAVAVVRTAERNERRKFAEQAASAAARLEGARLAKIPRAGASVRQLAALWGISKTSAREWVHRRLERGELVLDTTVTPMLVTRPPRPKGIVEELY